MCHGILYFFVVVYILILLIPFSTTAINHLVLWIWKNKLNSIGKKKIQTDRLIFYLKDPPGEGTIMSALVNVSGIKTQIYGR
jgi:hypothetical protein